MDELHTFIEQNGIAHITDKALPSSIREQMIQSDYVACCRVQNAATQGWELVFLTAGQVHAATVSGMGLQAYAVAKLKYQK